MPHNLESFSAELEVISIESDLTGNLKKKQLHKYNYVKSGDTFSCFNVFIPVNLEDEGRSFLLRKRNYSMLAEHQLGCLGWGQCNTFLHGKIWESLLRISWVQVFAPNLWTDIRHGQTIYNVSAECGGANSALQPTIVVLWMREPELLTSGSRMLFGAIRRL